MLQFDFETERCGVFLKPNYGQKKQQKFLKFPHRKNKEIFGFS
jgi:hypothetical protein